MNQHPTPGLIVVATDGTAAGRTGIEFATREARRRGAGLELVHVVPMYPSASTFPVIPDDSFNQYGREVLQQGSALVREIDPDAQFGTTLMTGARVTGITKCAAEAALLVLGSHPPMSAAEKFWIGTAVPGVASRAACPVLIVPADYDPNKVAGRVVVGVKVPARSAELLASAFALAEEFESELVIVHAWKLASGYDDLVSNEESRQEWRVQLEAEIEYVLADLRSDHPDVPVRIEIVHGPAAPALIDASRNADRLLISRPVHGGYFHHLGSTARAVLREGHCPVEVLPPHPAAGRDDVESDAQKSRSDVLVRS